MFVHTELFLKGIPRIKTKISVYNSESATFLFYYISLHVGFSSLVHIIISLPSFLVFVVYAIILCVSSNSWLCLLFAFKTCDVWRRQAIKYSSSEHFFSVNIQTLKPVSSLEIGFSLFLRLNKDEKIQWLFHRLHVKKPEPHLLFQEYDYEKQPHHHFLHVMILFIW